MTSRSSADEAGSPERKAGNGGDIYPVLMAVLYAVLLRVAFRDYLRRNGIWARVSEILIVSRRTARVTRS